MNSCLLSIIMPIYNGERYISDTITSLLLSEYKNIELILVNDGSKDQSINICQEFANSDARIHIVNKENGGIASARNCGLDFANGSYITFVDQDDYVPPEMYRELLTKLIDSKADMISSNPCTFTTSIDQYSVLGTIKTNEIIFDYKLEDLKKWLIMGEVMPSPQTQIPSTVWNCIFSTRVIRENNLRFKSYVQYDDDYIFLLEFLRKANYVALENKGYYRWRINPQSESHSRKYIVNLSDKLNKLFQYKINYMNDLSLTNEEYSHINHYFANRMLCNCIINESRKISNLSSFFNARTLLITTAKNCKKTYHFGSIANIKYIKDKFGPKAALVTLIARCKFISLSLFLSLLFS